MIIDQANIPISNNILASQGKQNQFEPILFIDIDQNGQFLISKKAVQYIQSIETDIAILTIVGSYRTGKSFLLNRFAGCQRGFELGPTTNPCTKGIWIWGKSCEDDNLTVLLLDTEGLNSYERDENSDARLLVLSCIISSSVLYNVMGVIDERTLETLSFTTNISKHLLGQDEFITQYLPNLVWVVRDFCLDLGGKSANMYMEGCLSQLEGESEEILQKNEIRLAISKYFRRRKCYTLIRPVNEEKLLRQLDKVGYNDLRPEFRNQVENLIDGVSRELQPKVFKGTALNSKSLIDLVGTFVQAINSNGVPNIENAWERIISKEFKRMMERVKGIVGQEFQLPIGMEQLFKDMNQRHKEAFQEILGYNISQEKRLEGVVLLWELMNERNQSLITDNILKSRKINQIISNKMYGVLDQLSDNNSSLTVGQVINQISNLKRIYFQEAKAPCVHENYVGLLELTIQVIEKVYNSNLIQWQNKEEDYKQDIVILKGKNQTLQELLTKEKDALNKQLEEVKITLQQERIIYESKLLDLNMEQVNVFQAPEQYIKKELKQQQIHNTEQFNQVLIDIHKKLEILQDSQQKVLATKIEIDEQKIYLKASSEIKEQMNSQQQSQIERVRLSLEGEIRVLKEDRHKLQEQREQLQLSLVEKDCELQIFKAKLKHMEKQKTKDIEHADMLCKISDQLVRAMKKFEKQK